MDKSLVNSRIAHLPENARVAWDSYECQRAFTALEEIYFLITCDVSPGKEAKALEKIRWKCMEVCHATPWEVGC